MKDNIFGYSWERIQRAQQKRGNLNDPVPCVNHDKEAARIQADVNRHKIPVHASVKASYAIVLPNGYSLDSDDVWRFKH